MPILEKNLVHPVQNAVFCTWIYCIWISCNILV
jgi:hypothetical protein